MCAVKLRTLGSPGLLILVSARFLPDKVLEDNSVYAQCCESADFMLASYVLCDILFVQLLIQLFSAD